MFRLFRCLAGWMACLGLSAGVAAPAAPEAEARALALAVGLVEGMRRDLELHRDLRGGARGLPDHAAMRANAVHELLVQRAGLAQAMADLPADSLAGQAIARFVSRWDEQTMSAGFAAPADVPAGIDADLQYVRRVLPRPDRWRTPWPFFRS